MPDRFSCRLWHSSNVGKGRITTQLQADAKDREELFVVAHTINWNLESGRYLLSAIFKPAWKPGAMTSQWFWFEKI